MPRQNRRRAAPDSDRGYSGGERRAQFNGTDYEVRAVSGRTAVKPYRCPGCDQEVRPGVAHVVCWPVSDVSGDERRHWHSGCWGARGSRRPGVQRSRSAPRY